MNELNRHTLAQGGVRAENAPASRGTPVRILQIGDGVFLRGFADWMIDVANGAGVFNGEVTIVPPRSRGITDALLAQNGLYTVLLRGVQNGEPVDAVRVVSCIEGVIDPRAQWREAIALAGDPALRFVLSNTTEVGIAYADEPFEAEHCPAGFPAKLAALLYARWQALGQADAPGLIVIPCELVEDNGTKLADCIERHALAWTLPPGFVQWLRGANVFCNTLVDRIVSGFPAAEADAIFTRIGCADRLLIAAEPFHLWVIEAPPGVSDEFPLHKAGLDVVWTTDAAPYRLRKVRMLNGAHTASALAAFSAGLDTVREMIDDPVVSAYLKRVMFDEIVPFVPLPVEECRAFAESVMERFANPHIRHELIAISLNSVSKWQVRLLPTVKEYARARGRAPAGLSFSLASLIHFYTGTESADGTLTGQRAASSYAIRDVPDVLAIFAAAHREHADADALVRTLLADARLWGEDLTCIPGLAEQTIASLAAIRTQGTKAAMAALAA